MARAPQTNLARPDTLHRIIINVSPDTVYAIEAIAGYACDLTADPAGLANNSASGDEAYASFPTVVTASAPPPAGATPTAVSQLSRGA